MTPTFPTKKYDLIYIDPPWAYYGDPNKDAAAGKHYQLMDLEWIKTLPVRALLKKRGAVFCWATCPRLDFAITTLEAWGLYYRGVAHQWVKTRKDGGIIYGQGVRATYSKPTTELLLLATTHKTGRTFPLLNEAIPQIVLAPREGHSTKPAVFRHHIEEAFGPKDRLEMFARGEAPPGWDIWGNEAL